MSNNPITGNPVGPLFNPLYTSEPSDKRMDAPTTGSGVNGQASVPNAPSSTLAQPGSQMSAAARMSLSAFMSAGKGVDTEVLLIQVAVAMRDTEATSQKAKINTDQETKRAEAKEKEKKLDDAQKKYDEAAEKKKGGSILDKIKLAFEWLGAVLAAATAAVLIATGVGTGVGIALMAAAVVAIVMAIDSTVQMATGMGIAGNAQMDADKRANARAEARGEPPAYTETQMQERAGKADMGLRISMAVIGIALAIASGGSSLVNGLKSVGSAISSGAKAVMSGLRSAENVAATAASTTASAIKAADNVENVATTTQTTAKAAMKIAEMVGKNADDVMKGLKTTGTTLKAIDNTQQVVNVGAEGASIGLKYQATEASADARKLEASAKIDQSIMELLDDMIDQALERLKASGDRFAAILDGITDAMQDRGNMLSRAQFKG